MDSLVLQQLRVRMERRVRSTAPHGLLACSGTGTLYLYTGTVRVYRTARRPCCAPPADQWYSTVPYCTGTVVEEEGFQVSWYGTVVPVLTRYCTEPVVHIAQDDVRTTYLPVHNYFSGGGARLLLHHIKYLVLHLLYVVTHHDVQSPFNMMFSSAD